MIGEYVELDALRHRDMRRAEHREMLDRCSAVVRHAEPTIACRCGRMRRLRAKQKAGKLAEVSW